MSYKAASWAAEQRGIGPYAKVLLHQLADRHNPDFGCFPHQETLARDCEFSRSTINEQLRKLEAAGLVKRVTKRHPVTKRQEPTRYYLAFEAGFAEIDGVDVADDQPEVSDESRVREPDTENDHSRVRDTGLAVSGSDPEPCPPGRTRIKGITSKLTSKVTSKRAVRAGRDLDFKILWKAFPVRPGSNQMEAWEIFETLEDADAAAALKGAERFAQHHREETSKYVGPAEDGPIRYVPHLSNWLRKQGWIAAATLPIKAPLPADAAALMAGKVTINKWSQNALFKACEDVKGTGPAPVGKSGSWSFAVEVVEEAKRRLALETGSGPPI